MDTPALVSLRSVVSSFFNRSNMDTKFMEKMSAIAIECFGDLNIYHVRMPRIAYLPVSDINTCVLPHDYIDYVRSPSMIIDGLIYPLTPNDSIPLQQDINCGKDVNPPITALSLEEQLKFETVNDFINYPYGMSFGYHLAANGGQNFCYYRIDKERRLIVLSGAVLGNTILLEYTSTGISVDSDVVIPRELVPVIRAYLMWQSIENDINVSLGEKQWKKRQYDEQLAIFHTFQSSMTASEIEDLLCGSYQQGAKR